MPDYLFDGKGMRIDGVTDGRPAAKAGLKKGDVVIQMGDSMVIDMMSYMRALSVFEEGNVTKVTVDREGEKKTVEITF
jgi:S1-C subfamily serine protease